MPDQQGDLFDYDAELRRYHEHLRAAIDVRPADRILDIGALHTVLTLQMTKDLLAPLDAARTGRALDQLRAAVAAHESGNGVWFDSRAWLIAARRP